MLDPLLRRFADAVDESEAARELNTLVEQHALPLARAIVRRKLGSHSGDRPGRSDAADREDVVAEAMVALIERLHSAKLDPWGASIENFDNYAATVIHSVCAHHIRRLYPERTRLKNRLRYVFSSDSRLALWTTSRNELACGLVGWRAREIDPASGTSLRRMLEVDPPNCALMSRQELTNAILKLLTDLGEPVEFERLVSAAASAAGVTELRSACDPADLASREFAQDVLADQRRFLARVWAEVGKLPVCQRVALLLNLRDANGGGLLWLLPIVGVATVRQIAQLLEISHDEFASLWREIPLDDAAIGARLGCTRQQVINLRMSARKRLTNIAGGPARPVSSFGRREGNLAPVSSSLRGKA